MTAGLDNIPEFTALFEKKIQQYIRDHGLLTEGDTVIVGLSGGADSVALAAVLTALGYRCVAVHCNYHLRGAESERDAAFAVAVAERLGILCHVTDFHPTGSGIEEQCRHMRYSLFDSAMHRHRCTVIAVGHHLEDNVETFMFNAMRGGASLRSLKAMTPRRGNIIRPLLAVTRSDIEEYLHSCGLSWITDSSNASDSYARNRIRNGLLPALRQCRADAVERLASTIERLQDNYLLFTDYIRDLRIGYSDATGAVDVAAIIAEHPHPVQALYEILNSRDSDSGNVLSLTQIRNILDAACDTEPHYFRRSDGVTLVLERGRLSRLEQCEEELTFRATDGVPGLIEADVIAIADFRPQRDPYTLYIDADSEAANGTLTLRAHRKGDRIRPFGMNGSKLVSDIYHDAGLNTVDRRQRRIVEYDGKILWITGLRTSREYTVTPSTRRVLRLHAVSAAADDARTRR